MKKKRMKRKVTSMESEFMVRLESLVDESSIAEVLETLVAICYAKGQHIEENWQSSGWEWFTYAKVIDKFVSNSKW